MKGNRKIQEEREGKGKRNRRKRINDGWKDRSNMTSKEEEETEREGKERKK